MIEMRSNVVAMGNTVSVNKDEVRSGGEADGLIQDLAFAESLIGLADVFDWERRARREGLNKGAHLGAGAVVGNDYLELGKRLATESGQHEFEFAHCVVDGD